MAISSWIGMVKQQAVNSILITTSLSKTKHNSTISSSGFGTAKPQLVILFLWVFLITLFQVIQHFHINQLVWINASGKPHLVGFICIPNFLAWDGEWRSSDWLNWLQNVGDYLGYHVSTNIQIFCQYSREAGAEFCQTRRSSLELIHLPLLSLLFWVGGQVKADQNSHFQKGW